MRTSNITKLRTCGCGLEELGSCGLAVADFKNYKVADLRLRIQESRKVVADLRLRTKLLNVQLRTCGCGLRKLKFGCGFADCGLKKKLAVPSTDFNYYKENFNYGFDRPKTDICTVCAELEASIKLSKNVGEKNPLTAKLDLHQRKAKVFYKQLKEKSAVAKKNMDTECLCFDFKQNMPYPHIATSDVFYSRQLWLFVFGIYSAKTGKSRIYTWPETKARRSVNEVVSCLDDYITKYLDPTVRSLQVFTDGCRGQNHNNTMVQYLHSLVLNKRLDSVTHRLPMRGHSYLPCDREFGVIERMQKRRDHIEIFTEWDDMLRERFEVTSMEGRQMKDFKRTLGKFYKTNAKDWKITKYKVFKYSSKTNLEIITCEDMNARQEQKFLLLKSSFRKIVYPTDSLNTGPCAINSKKVKDVQSLARYLLREDSRGYMKSLTEKMPCGMAGEDSDYEE